MHMVNTKELCNVILTQEDMMDGAVAQDLQRG